MEADPLVRNKPTLLIVIMAGGTGTRFWPLSTKEKPKQFLDFFGDRTLLQHSYDRVSEIVPPENVLVLTHSSFIPIVREQLPNLPDKNIIGEPIKRDTAAAVTLAALLIEKRYGKSVIATLTADHLIQPVSEFHSALLSCVDKAWQSPFLYTFGVEPTYPATAYGYLEKGEKVAEDDGVVHYELIRFKEKPDLETAAEYVRSGGYYWNSGMFVWSTETILNELNTHLPGHMKEIKEAVQFDDTDRWEQALYQAFLKIPKISIDFAIMEKAKRVRCVTGQFSWSDVGGWLALGDFLPKDDAGNQCRGKVVCLDAAGNTVFCQDSEETVMLVGVNNLVLVRAPQGILVVDKDRTEDIKKLVEAMQSNE